MLGFLGRAFRALIHWVGLPAAFFLTLPGILVREGSRVIVARLSGTSRRGRKFYSSLGTEYGLVPLPRPALHICSLLGPALIAFAVGVVWLIPALVKRDVLGTTLAPAFTRDFGTVSDDTDLLVRLMAGSTPAIWFAVACLFVALPPHEQLRQARWELLLGGPLGRAFAAGLWPLQLVARVAAPVDSLLEYTGLPAIIGSGLLGVLGGAIVAERLATLFY